MSPHSSLKKRSRRDPELAVKRLQLKDPMEAKSNLKNASEIGTAEYQLCAL
jgi:hypothetical protein